MLNSLLDFIIKAVKIYFDSLLTIKDWRIFLSRCLHYRIIKYNYRLFLRFRTFIVSIGLLRVLRVDCFPGFAEFRTLSRFLLLEILLFRWGFLVSKMHVMRYVIFKIKPWRFLALLHTTSSLASYFVKRIPLLLIFNWRNQTLST